MGNNINSILDEAPSMNDGQSNEATVIKSKIMAIVGAMTLIEEERDAMKEIVAELKETHSIPPKVAKMVAKLLKSPEKIQEMEEESFAIEQLYAQVTKGTSS